MDVALTLTNVGKTMKLIYLDGVKIGSVHKTWQTVSQAGHLPDKKELLWTGEITVDGVTKYIGRTAMVAGLRPKIEILLRQITAEVTKR